MIKIIGWIASVKSVRSITRWEWWWTLKALDWLMRTFKSNQSKAASMLCRIFLSFLIFHFSSSLTHNCNLFVKSVPTLIWWRFNKEVEWRQPSQWYRTVIIPPDVTYFKCYPAPTGYYHWARVWMPVASFIYIYIYIYIYLVIKYSFKPRL